MSALDRYVVLGVAQVRAPWFREVARWATSAMVPMEFVKAMSIEEVRVRLRTGRSYSALLVDDAMVGVDRDVVGLAQDAGCAVVVVDSGRAVRTWSDLGVSAVLPSTFDRDDLVQVLAQVATPIARHVEGPAVSAPRTDPDGYRGRLVAVTGAGGTGRSTLAIALAQGLAADPRYHDVVCLVDLALDAEQAMLHASPDVVPGLVEVVDAHRAGTPTVDDVRGLCWAVPERGYHLVLGLRRHRDWTAVRPRAFTAALDGLRHSFRLVVADVDADVEGETSTGSLDVEERNTMARVTLAAADLVVVVGTPGMKGLHALLRTTRALLAHGVSSDHVVPVINRAPKGPGARAELTAAFGALLDLGPDQQLPSPVHLADRRHLDDAFRDGTRLPDAWLAPLCTVVMGLLDGMASRPDLEATRPSDGLTPVPPGQLGSWSEEP